MGLNCSCISVHCADESTSKYLNFFDKATEQLLGVPDVKAKETLDKGQIESFQQIFGSVVHKVMLFVVSVSINPPDADPIPQCNVLGVTPIDCTRETAVLMSQLEVQ